MKVRNFDRRVRLTVPGRPVTRAISPREIENYLLATGWPLVRGNAGPPPSVGDRTWPLTRIISMIAAREGRSPGEVLLRIESHALGLSPELAPRDIQLTQEDLSALAEEARVFDRFEGVRPWDMKRLWGSVHLFGLRAEGRVDRELFQQAHGALLLLDLLETKYGRGGAGGEGRGR